MNLKKSSPWMDISGHMYDDECQFLHTLAKDKLVLEIGTHHGKSTAALASSAAFVTTIDSYQGDPQINAPVYDVTKNNLKEFDNISLMIGRWQDLKINYSNYDMVFYDGCHTEEADFLTYLLTYHNIIIFHDYKPNEPGMKHVVKALDNYSKSTRKPLLKGPGSLAWFNNEL